jgi:hypothetical protein
MVHCKENRSEVKGHSLNKSVLKEGDGSFLEGSRLAVGEDSRNTPQHTEIHI